MESDNGWRHDTAGPAHLAEPTRLHEHAVKMPGNCGWHSRPSAAAAAAAAVVGGGGVKLGSGPGQCLEPLDEITPDLQSGKSNGRGAIRPNVTRKHQLDYSGVRPIFFKKTVFLVLSQLARMGGLTPVPRLHGDVSGWGRALGRWSRERVMFDKYEAMNHAVPTG